MRARLQHCILIDTLQVARCHATKLNLVHAGADSLFAALRNIAHGSQVPLDMWTLHMRAPAPTYFKRKMPPAFRAVGTKEVCSSHAFVVQEACGVLEGIVGMLVRLFSGTVSTRCNVNQMLAAHSVACTEYN